MKLGVCLEMFFQDRPFVDRIKAAADAGYSHAEMWFIDGTATSPDNIDFDDAKDPEKIAKAASCSGVTLTNAVIGAPDGSIGGGLTDPGKRREWLERTAMTLEFCSAAGIGACIVCTGNNVKGRSRKAMNESVVAGLKATAEKAEAAGVNLWLEPLNDKVDHPDYFCTGSRQGAAICREVNSPRLKMLYDCYHMQIMEGDLLGNIRRELDVIGHFHSAGHPGRHELWLGETNYPFVVRQLEALGYKGVFSLEYLPTIDSAESLSRTRKYLDLDQVQNKILPGRVWVDPISCGCAHSEEPCKRIV